MAKKKSSSILVIGSLAALGIYLLSDGTSDSVDEGSGSLGGQDFTESDPVGGEFLQLPGDQGQYFLVPDDGGFATGEPSQEPTSLAIPQDESLFDALGGGLGIGLGVAGLLPSKFSTFGENVGKRIFGDVGETKLQSDLPSQKLAKFSDEVAEGTAKVVSEASAESVAKKGGQSLLRKTGGKFLGFIPYAGTLAGSGYDFLYEESVQDLPPAQRTAVVGSVNTLGDYVGGLAGIGGAAGGAAIGSLLAPGVGTIIGGAIGGITGAVGGQIGVSLGGYELVERYVGRDLNADVTQNSNIEKFSSPTKFQSTNSQEIEFITLDAPLSVEKTKKNNALAQFAAVNTQQVQIVQEQNRVQQLFSNIRSARAKAREAQARKQVNLPIPKPKSSGGGGKPKFIYQKNLSFAQNIKNNQANQSLAIKPKTPFGF